MSKQQLLNETRRLTKLAGLLKEDDYSLGTPTGDTDAMGDTDTMSIGEAETEGYIELMGDNFNIAVDKIVFAWTRWKQKPGTSEEDIEPAKNDILHYIGSKLK